MTDNLPKQGQATPALAPGKPVPGAAEGLRLDKWLWAARFYKTRSQAGVAVTGGKVNVNDATVKRAKHIKVGDTIRVRKGPYEFIVVVRVLSDRRGKAAEAQTLYEETAESKSERERIAEELRLERESAPPPPPIKYLGKGRPTKKDRRALDRLADRDPFDL